MTSPTTAPRRARTARPKLDAIASAAVELAHEALLEVTEPGQVGEHLRVEASGERLVTHIFECTMPGYRGWSWVVVLTRASRAKAATVAETALLPGEESILAPDWEPWSERLKPSDVGADDLLPYRDDDERLEQGYEATGDEDVDRVAQWELGLGRPRVLSAEGRSDAAERWLEGDFGPRETSGRGRRGTVTANCTSCGFLSKLSGSLRGEFGVCTNEWSPADGRVVHLNFGCGAHSETGQEDEDREISRSSGVIVDELDVEYQQDAPADAAGESAVVGASTEETPAEETPAAETPAAAAPVHDDVILVTPVTGQLSFESLGAEVPEADSPED
ncbi:DUF3027 domain-containing protein [Brachybacterium paraconglomeratum]|uniref:DUF3027 domain-containing protein n=1 Tax=Brachybacterium paraconglomeratum TaxID=173362 RepID=UPI0031E54948